MKKKAVKLNAISGNLRFTDMAGAFFVPFEAGLFLFSLVHETGFSK